MDSADRFDFIGHRERRHTCEKLIYSLILRNPNGRRFAACAAGGDVFVQKKACSLVGKHHDKLTHIAAELAEEILRYVFKEWGHFVQIIFKQTTGIVFLPSI